MEQVLSLHPHHRARNAQPGAQPGAQSAAASGSGQPSQQQQPTEPAAPSTAQPSAGDQAGPSQGNAARTGGTRSPPQPALFRTPAQTPTAGDAARGLAQVLGDNARTGQITSAMFGSAMEAAMAAARQVTTAPLLPCLGAPHLLAFVWPHLFSLCKQCKFSCLTTPCRNI